jgi:hypothetical protein
MSFYVGEDTPIATIEIDRMIKSLVSDAIVSNADKATKRSLAQFVADWNHAVDPKNQNNGILDQLELQDFKSKALEWRVTINAKGQDPDKAKKKTHPMWMKLAAATGLAVGAYFLVNKIWRSEVGDSE